MHRVRLSRRGLIGGAVASVLLTACGVGSSLPRLPVVGRQSVAFWFNSPPQMKAFEAFVARFHQEQDKVELAVRLVPAIDLDLVNALRAGAPPDAVRVSGGSMSWIARSGPDGYAAALDSWDPLIGTYDWIKPTQRGVSRHGKMYAMPVNSGAMCLVYNRDVYRGAGLDPDKPPETVAELMETAIKIARPGAGTWGHYTTTDASLFPALLFVHGGRDVSDEGKVLFSSEEGVSALRWQAELVRRGGAPAAKIDSLNILDGYLAGKVGSMVTTPGNLASVERASFPSGAAQHPRATAQTVPLTFGVIAILAASKAKDAAWEFARYTGLVPRNNVAWTQGYGSLPPRLSYRETESWKAYESAHPLLAPFLEAQKTSDTLYDGPGAALMWLDFSRAIEDGALGNKSPRQALDAAAVVCQGIIDRERSRVS
jgi:multiple sugar transport system substrate-binding protein